MSYNVQMTKLLNKIERRLGTKLIKLPKEIDKEAWIEVITEDTLETFSRFFPNSIFYEVNTSRDRHKKPGMENFYYIDEAMVPGDIQIYGLRDVDFNSLASTGVAANSIGGWRDPIYGSMFGFEDVALTQARADMNSMVNTGVYPTYEHPHMIKLEGAGGLDITTGLSTFRVELFVKHANNLTTISPTKMETFEELAELDIKIFLYNSLKLFQGIDTVFGTIDLKIDDWEGAANERKEFVEQLREKYISADNLKQPIMYTV